MLNLRVSLRQAVLWVCDRRTSCRNSNKYCCGQEFLNLRFCYLFPNWGLSYILPYLVEKFGSIHDLKIIIAHNGFNKLGRILINSDEFSASFVFTGSAGYPSRSWHVRSWQSSRRPLISRRLPGAGVVTTGCDVASSTVRGSAVGGESSQHFASFQRVRFHALVVLDAFSTTANFIVSII